MGGTALADANATCTACNGDTWSAGTLACTSWTALCSPGYEPNGGTRTVDAECKVCQTQYFSADGTACIPWTPCNSGDEPVGTTTPDAVCTACDDGTWSAGIVPCTAWSECNQGFVTGAGSAAADVHILQGHATAVPGTLSRTRLGTASTVWRRYHCCGSVHVQCKV